MPHKAKARSAGQGLDSRHWPRRRTRPRREAPGRVWTPGTSQDTAQGQGAKRRAGSGLQARAKTSHKAKARSAGQGLDSRHEPRHRTSPRREAPGRVCKRALARWSWRWDSNPRPADYESAALPTEPLQQRKLPAYYILFGAARQACFLEDKKDPAVDEAAGPGYYSGSVTSLPVE